MVERYFLEMEFEEAVHEWYSRARELRDRYFEQVRNMEIKTLRTALEKSDDAMLAGMLREIISRVAARRHRLVVGARDRGRLDLWVAHSEFDAAYLQAYPQPNPHDPIWWTRCAEAIDYERARRKAA